MSLKNNPDFLQNLFRIEMNGEARHSYKFKSFRLDVAERQLLNEDTPVPLTPKAFDVLVYLVARSGHLVEKEELMQSVWADAFVEEANLTRTIHTLRKALGEDQNGNKFISTVAKKGYRFVAEVESDNRSESKSSIGGENGSAAYIWPDELEVGRVEAKIEQATAPAVNRKILKPIVFACLGLLLAGSLVAFIAFQWNAQPARNGQPVSIAVLPFRPLDLANRDEADDLFFADSLINQLSQEKNLKVRPLSAVRGYSDVKQDALAIGREQKVDYVLESNYVVRGERLRVTSQLFDVRSGSVEPVISLEADASDLFAAADNIVAKIGRDLLAKLEFKPLDLAPNRRTENEQAWKHYVHGMNLTNKRIREDSDKAIVEFENAIRIDPNYADAYVGLAYAHETSYVNGGIKADHCRAGKEAADRAIELAPSLGEAYSIKAMNTVTCERNPNESEELHRKALELAPNSAFVRRFYGIFLTSEGKGDESVAELKIAIDLDPNLPWTEKLLGRALYFANRYDEAIEQLKKTRQLDNTDPTQTAYLFRSYALKDDFAQAFEWFLVTEALKGSTQKEIDSFKQAYAEAGWPGVLRARLQRAELNEKEGRTNLTEIASLAAQLGDKDKAFKYLKKKEFLAKPEPDLGNLVIEPTFDSLRSDPRFESIVALNWLR